MSTVITNDVQVEYIDQDDDIADYADEWVAQIDGGPENAEEVAKSNGYELVREV